MKKCILFIIFLLGIVSNATAQVQPTDTDGDGYINISTLDHLRWLSGNPTAWALNYELDNDIDAAATQTWDSGAGWTPIGNDFADFTGKFEGNGFAIDNLYINRPKSANIGLFGITNEVEISNLGIKNCKIIGNYCVGGLVGFSISTTVSNSYSTGDVSGVYDVGGLVGYNSFSFIVSNSNSTVSVSGSEYIGGLVGKNLHTTVSNSRSSGSVSGEEYIGGLVGANYYSEVSNSYSAGNVSGRNSIGGLVGYDNSSAVSKCYSIGKVSGKYAFGGLVGGKVNSTVSNCFWDKQTSGTDTSAGGIGKTTAEMKTKSTFTIAGWDFNSTWAIAADYNNGYPYLDGKNGSNGIKEIHSSSLIYPQPAANELFVRLSETSQELALIKLYDQVGQLAFVQETSANDGLIRLNTSALASGVYRMLIRINGKFFTENVVLAK